MSFEGLQERLAALQETTSQVRELIDRLAELKFQPGSVPLGADEEDSVSGELNAEIGQLLRSGLEDQELLQEEVKYLRPEGHDKERLQDSVSRVGHELSRYVLHLMLFQTLYMLICLVSCLQLSFSVSKSANCGEKAPRGSAETRTTAHPQIIFCSHR